MSKETRQPHSDESPEGEIVDAEVVDDDALPMLAEVQEVQAPAPNSVPAIHAAALAAGGFFAGALTMALAKRYAARRLADAATGHGLAEAASRLPGAVRPARPGWPAPGETRTFLVTVRSVPRPVTRPVPRPE